MVPLTFVEIQKMKDWRWTSHLISYFSSACVCVSRIIPSQILMTGCAEFWCHRKTTKMIGSVCHFTLLCGMASLRENVKENVFWYLLSAAGKWWFYAKQIVDDALCICCFPLCCLTILLRRRHILKKSVSRLNHIAESCIERMLQAKSPRSIKVNITFLFYCP